MEVAETLDMIWEPRFEEAKDILGTGGEHRGNFPAFLLTQAAGDCPAQWREAGQPTSTDLVNHQLGFLEEDERRRRCRFWAMNNLQPVVYQEFSRLEPEKMDDLDRFLWRSILHSNESLGTYDDDDARRRQHSHPSGRGCPGIHCRDYWAEPLNARNAGLRNHGFETQCRRRLEERITNRYYNLTDAANYQEDNDLVLDTPNQYVRVLEWLDMDAERNSSNPKGLLTSSLEEQSRYPYAHMGDHIPNQELRG